MSRFLLRKSSAAAVSPERAEQLLNAAGSGKLLHRDGDNLLAEIDAAQLEQLRAQLDGWTLAEQGPKIPVPNSRLKLGS
ncbi:MAG TPA: hypothetical protein VGP06_01395 [Janthinobacterium sp.]|jgi:hypothetical protein|nr:hypothetical protein [Janthinobacterium sp.]